MTLLCTFGTIVDLFLRFTSKPTKDEPVFGTPKNKESILGKICNQFMKRRDWGFRNSKVKSITASEAATFESESISLGCSFFIVNFSFFYCKKK